MTPFQTTRGGDGQFATGLASTSIHAATFFLKEIGYIINTHHVLSLKEGAMVMVMQSLRNNKRFGTG